MSYDETANIASNVNKRLAALLVETVELRAAVMKGDPAAVGRVLDAKPAIVDSNLTGVRLLLLPPPASSCCRRCC